MTKVNQDPFSNGTEHMRFEEMNCDRCIKNSHLKDDEVNYTKVVCAIQRDIFTRMYSNEPISKRTIDICESGHCPYLKENWPKRKHKRKSQTQETTLF